MKKRIIVLTIFIFVLVCPIILAQETQMCEGAGFLCTKPSSCLPENERNTYLCSGVTDICCTEETKKCEEMIGEICNENEKCLGSEERAIDTNYCCIGGCEKIIPKLNECLSGGYGCYSSCPDKFSSMLFSCGEGAVCCTKDSEFPKAGFYSTFIENEDYPKEMVVFELRTGIILGLILIIFSVIIGLVIGRIIKSKSVKIPIKNK